MYYGTWRRGWKVPDCFWNIYCNNLFFFSLGTLFMDFFIVIKIDLYFFSYVVKHKLISITCELKSTEHYIRTIIYSYL